ncbi:MAG TPA: hypothetical protein VGR96_13095 [Acidobacteriaceae bacterium]|nr:hypothetical protein [Acidobacteriaceae bacterium]
MTSGRKRISSPGELRAELSRRNLERAAGFEHELTYGRVPSVLYTPQPRCPEGKPALHGNFLAASYRSILADPEWEKRLRKAYSASRYVARSWERQRRELDCANSSDALLMNIFCYPGALRRPGLCALLGIEPGRRPVFGFKPGIPLLNGRADRTEIDMSLGPLLVEAKLTEGAQRISLERLLRYRDLEEVFEVEELPVTQGVLRAGQLVRGVLAAHQLGRSFLLLSDERRADLVESWFQVLRAVRTSDLRSRLVILSWQELAATLAAQVQVFLSEKYGIIAA